MWPAVLETPTAEAWWGSTAPDFAAPAPAVWCLRLGHGSREEYASGDGNARKKFRDTYWPPFFGRCNGLDQDPVSGAKSGPVGGHLAGFGGVSQEMAKCAHPDARGTTEAMQRRRGPVMRRSRPSPADILSAPGRIGATSMAARPAAVSGSFSRMVRAEEGPQQKVHDARAAFPSDR
jgi:hypothetical protein